MTDQDQRSFYIVQDFRRARRRADIEDLLARLTGKPGDLLSYDDVRRTLKASGGIARGLHDIPLDAIVGSVGRYADFTRSFLPRHDSDGERWSRVQRVVQDAQGFEPIRVYKVGTAYFVIDGNHRVSVARQSGATHIHAYVTELQTRVPLTPDTSPDTLILKAEYVEFLERTGLDVLRPDAQLEVTAPGQYELIEEHVEVHRYMMALAEARPISPEEALGHWYDTVYLPAVQLIRERGLLRAFPGRTETDLYVWIYEHRSALAAELGWEVAPEMAAADLVNRHGRQPWRIAGRVGERLFEPGPRPGQWRREHLAGRQEHTLFADVLVPLSGEEESWSALEQALLIAQHEHARLHGLHVTPAATQPDNAAARAIYNEFRRRCAHTGLPGDLAFETGGIARQICARARWADLVVVKLAHPPSPRPVARLRSGFRTLLLRCPCPLLAVPHDVSPMRRALLAYDGSPKAEEALLLAAYMALRWQMSLAVVMVLEPGRTNEETLQRACSTLEAHGVPVTTFVESGPVADAIMRTAETHASDLIIIGGYGFSPVLELVLGGTVDQILRESRVPVLICR